MAGEGAIRKSAFCVVPTDSRFAEHLPRSTCFKGEWLGEGGERNVVLNRKLSGRYPHDIE